MYRLRLGIILIFLYRISILIMAPKSDMEKTLHTKNSKPFPQWLLTSLCIENSLTQCNKHTCNKTKPLQMYFCTELDCCMRVCEMCKNQDHNGHDVIQLRLVTRNMAFEGRDLRRKNDISLDDVQIYNCNKIHDMYHLFGRPGKNKSGVLCKICHHKLISGKFKFCSLECMVKATSCKGVKARTIINQGNQIQEIVSSTSKSVEDHKAKANVLQINTIVVWRQRHRKQISPRRSPIY